LLFLLEYRGTEISLLHRDTFSLPKNLFVIGTMNTADRSIRSVDSALRRRFDVFECPPRGDILDAYFADGRYSEVDDLSAGMDRLNERLAADLDRHHAIGHSFFMADPYRRVDLERTWERQVRPLIEEYFFDEPDRLEGFTIEDFWPTP
jgi:5-methylcytosine-specific restriction protein B